MCVCSKCKNILAAEGVVFADDFIIENEKTLDCDNCCEKTDFLYIMD